MESSIRLSCHALVPTCRSCLKAHETWLNRRLLFQYRSAFNDRRRKTSTMGKCHHQGKQRATQIG